MDFDEDRLYYSHQALQQERPDGENADANANDTDNVNLTAVRRHFREFLRTLPSYLLTL